MTNKLTFTIEGECSSVDEAGIYPIPDGAKSELPLRFTLADGEVQQRYEDLDDEAAILEHARLQDEAAAEFELELAQTFKISTDQFKVWLGSARRIGVRELGKTDPIVHDFEDSLTFIEYVDSKDPELIAALDYLESKGDPFEDLKSDFYATAVDRKIV